MGVGLTMGGPGGQNGQDFLNCYISFACREVSHICVTSVCWFDF